MGRPILLLYAPIARSHHLLLATLSFRAPLEGKHRVLLDQGRGVSADTAGFLYVIAPNDATFNVTCLSSSPLMPSNVTQGSPMAHQQQQQQQQRYQQQMRPPAHSGSLLQQLQQSTMQQGAWGGRAPATGGTMPPPPARLQPSQPTAATALPAQQPDFSTSSAAGHSMTPQSPLQRQWAGGQMAGGDPGMAGGGPGMAQGGPRNGVPGRGAVAGAQPGLGPKLFPGQQSVEAVQQQHQQHLQQWRSLSHQQQQARQHQLLAQQPQPQQQQQQQHGGDFVGFSGQQTLSQQHYQRLRLQQQEAGAGARPRSQGSPSLMAPPPQRSASFGRDPQAQLASPAGSGATSDPLTSAVRQADGTLQSGSPAVGPRGVNGAVGGEQAMQPHTSLSMASPRGLAGLQHMRGGVNGGSSPAHANKQQAEGATAIPLPAQASLAAPASAVDRAPPPLVFGGSDPTLQLGGPLATAQPPQFNQLPVGGQMWAAPPPTSGALAMNSNAQHPTGMAPSLQQQAVAAAQHALQLQHHQARASAGPQALLQQQQELLGRGAVLPQPGAALAGPQL